MGQSMDNSQGAAIEKVINKVSAQIDKMDEKPIGKCVTCEVPDHATCPLDPNCSCCVDTIRRMATSGVAPIAVPAAKPQKPVRIVVVAKTATEMEGAQKELVVWVESRMTELKTELKDAETNLALFTKNKWRTEPSKKALSKIQKNYEYYEKMKAALEAGYVIIPNFPDQGFDVFAVRTTAKNPRQNQTTGTWNRGTKDQVTNSPPLKEGRYVSPDAVENSISDTLTKPDGRKEPQITVWAEEFRDVAFPFRMAKPQILEDTAQAMKLGIFDEMIASPKFRQSKPRGDPMIMGRIIIKEGYHTKAVTFLVTWFVDTNDL